MSVHLRFLLLLDGILLLQHSGVDQFMPLLMICSTMPSRVDPDVEEMNISGNLSQVSQGRPLGLSILWVGCSLQLPGLCDDLLHRIFKMTKELVFGYTPAWSSLWHIWPPHLSHDECMGCIGFSSGTTCQRHLFCLRVSWSLSRCHNSTARWAECRPCTDRPLGKSTLSEQPGFCDFVFELRWPVVPGFEPRCSWCSG